MRRTRGFILAEVLVAFGILALLAALLHPVFRSAQGRAQEARCMNNFKQIYTAPTLYRERYDGTDAPAPPSQMGLPPHFIFAFGDHADREPRLEVMKCFGHPKDGNLDPFQVYTQMWPPPNLPSHFEPNAKDFYVAAWVSHVDKMNLGAILLADQNHQLEPHPNYKWSNYRNMGITLSGSIRWKIARGALSRYSWWE